MFFTCGIIAAIATAVAFLLSGRGVITTIFFSAFAFLLWGTVGWFSMPTLAWNFGAIWVLMLLFGFGLAFGLSATQGNRYDEVGLGALVSSAFVAVPILMALVAFISTDGFFGHENQYRAWLGREPVVREFSQEVAPVDINHLRLVNGELATQIASRTVEQVQSLGSRVHVGTPDRQILNGRFTAVTGTGETAVEQELVFENELVYVAPLAHDSVFRYMNYGSTPG